MTNKVDLLGQAVNQAMTAGTAVAVVLRVAAKGVVSTLVGLGVSTYLTENQIPIREGNALSISTTIEYTSGTDSGTRHIN